MSGKIAATTGRILTSEINAFDRPDETMERHEVQYYHRISYEYTVNEQRYTSSNVYSSDVDKEWVSADRDAQQRIVEQFPHGAHVTVYYNRHNPAQAFLKRRRGGSNMVQYVGAFVLSAIALLTVLALVAQAALPF